MSQTQPNHGNRKGRWKSNLGYVSMIKNVPDDADFDTPENLINRQEELESIRNIRPGDSLYLYGPRGSGKTVTTQSALNRMDNELNKVYVSCIQQDTQYKVLSRILYRLTGEKVESGYHSSDLKRKLDKHLGSNTVIVLDEIDFLLQNDRGSTLYYLSRFNDGPRLILISSNYELPNVDGRVKSSLYYQTVEFREYTEKEVYEILSDRTPDEFDTSMLKQISSRTRNVDFALYWLSHVRRNLEKREGTDTGLVEDVREEAVHLYWNSLLQDFSGHHHTLLESTLNLSKEESVNSGDIYRKYEEMCRRKERETLSERRVSDFLKHLELLGIVEAEYHYGGKKGKTREIRLQGLEDL